MKKILIALSGFLFVTGCKEKPADTGNTADTKPSAVATEEGVILAIEGEPMPVGKVMISDFSMGMENGKVTVKLPTQEVEGVLSMNQKKKRKVESIGENKYRYTVVEDKKTERSTMMGKEQPEKETINPLEGVKVIAEKGADGTWTAKLESGEATADMEEELKKIAKEAGDDLSSKIYGTVPRKVGDEWESSGSEMLGIKGGKGTMKLKFEAIEDFGGESCAKLTGSLDVTGSPDGEAPEGMVMRMKGDFVVFRSIKHRVDRQNKLVGTMEVSGDLEPQPGMKMTMHMGGKMESLGSTEMIDEK